MDPAQTIRTVATITAVVVNYKTLDLTRRCVESWLAAYPDVPLLLIDNGSGDQSSDYIRQVGSQHEIVTAILNEANYNHGPALHQGIARCSTPYVFTLDSDCEVQRGGFLEAMLALFSDPLLYAVGSLRTMDRYGYELKPGSHAYTRYVHPHAMLLDREKYATLPPFVHHGSPCLKNMHAAERRGYHLHDFAVEQYILHRGRGTCSRYGYNLDIRTTVQNFLSRCISGRTRLHNQ